MTPSHPRRQLRNYLLDWRFQLKYSLMVVAVTAAVASVLGYFAYDFSRGQTEALTVQIAAQPDMDPMTARELRQFAEQHDRRVLLGIFFGIALICVTLGLTGVVITHKVVGPAHKMRMLMSQIEQGNLDIQGSLRRGDELQDVFDSLSSLTQRLRAQRRQRHAMLQEVVDRLGNDPGAQDVVSRVKVLMDSDRPSHLPPSPDNK